MRIDSSTQRHHASGLFDRLLRRQVMKKLADLSGGTVRIEDANGVSHAGAGGELHCRVRVHNSRFYRQTVLGGSLGAASSYVSGDWDCDDLTALFRLFVRSQAAGQLDHGWSSLARWFHRRVHRWHANSRLGSRRNICAHYDLGNDFFELWLDPTMSYSCGLFMSPETTLHEASIEKFDRVCRKLDLQPHDHVLEIGTGWGGLAIHAAQNYGCRVTTTTISKQQLEFARRRIDDAGLTGRITLLSQDYRDLPGRYDKLISIEMIEAVGHEYLDAYFAKCAQLLAPEGTMLLQAIVMPERGFREYMRSVDFIRRYIFPGGCLPSVGAILESVGRASGLRLVHAEDFAPHYAETLRRWRATFQQRLPDVRRLGYPNELIRLWEYYLCYCEAAFEERHVGVVQLQFDNWQCHRDPMAIARRAGCVPAAAAPTETSALRPCPA